MKKRIVSALFGFLSAMLPVVTIAEEACKVIVVVDGDKKTIYILKSCDPNEIKGPEGVGEARLVKPGDVMDYTIYFENVSNATAAAQEVRVTLPKDPGLDWSTLEFGEVAFGENIDLGLATRKESEYRLPGSDCSVKTVVTVTDTTVEWYLRSWDPNTPDNFPANIADGFLPPNDETGRGEGHLRFRVKVKEDAAPQSVIRASASIVFDANPPITTDPAWWNTVGDAKGVKVSVDGEETTLDLFVGLPYGELPEPGVVPVGHTFGGWYTAPGGPHGAGRLVTATSLVEAGDEGLYQYWEANAYKVHFEPNGAESGEMPDQPFVYGVAQALTSNRFVKVGHSFAGWASGEGADVTQWADGGVVSNLTDVADGVVNLYAVWTANVYRVTFDSNGGSAVAPISAKYGEEVLAPASPTRTGYAFAGWYAGDAAVSFPMAMSAEDLALTAHWTEIAYKVHFVPNGAESGEMPDQPFVYGVEQALASNRFVKVGHSFAGWADGEGGGVTQWADGEVVSNLTDVADGVVNLYAVWTESGTPSDPEEPIDPVVTNTPPVLYVEAETHVNVEAREIAPYTKAAVVYDGYLYDENGLVKGTVQVKVAKGKSNRATGAFEAKVTATVQLADGSKKISFKGGIADETGTVVDLAAKEHTLEVSLGVNGLGGTFDGKYKIDGVRNRFTSKDKAEKSEVDAFVKGLTGAINIVLSEGRGILSVAIAAKGKVKIAGTVEGNKVSATSQLLVGEGVAVVPVVIAKKVNIAFCLWIKEGLSVEMSGLNSEISEQEPASTLGVVGWAGKIGTEAKFILDEVAVGKLAGMLGGLYSDYLPTYVDVASNGKKWVVAGGAKAGKLVLRDKATGELDTDKSKFTDNMSGLKLTYKEKDGTFTGTFKVYNFENGKVKSYSANVTGVMIEAKGYGTATIKKVGSVEVTIE